MHRGRDETPPAPDPTCEGLLRRPRLAFDAARHREALAGRRVCVTGAGGSIGGALARRVATLGPRTLLLVERSEADLYEVHRSLESADGEVVPILGDAGDPALLDEVFGGWHPDLVFHAAAVKHVPLVESQPLAAVTTNVLGSAELFAAAVREFIEKARLSGRPFFLGGAVQTGVTALASAAAVAPNAPHVAVG